MKITIISAVSASCGSVFVLQIVCWPFLQRFVCSGADKLSETATSGGNCRRGAHSTMLWKALKYSAKRWNTAQCVEIQLVQNSVKYYSVHWLKIWSSMLHSKCYRLPWNSTAIHASLPDIQKYREQYLKIQYKCARNRKKGNERIARFMYLYLCHYLYLQPYSDLYLRL